MRVETTIARRYVEVTEGVGTFNVGVNDYCANNNTLTKRQVAMTRKQLTELRDRLTEILGDTDADHVQKDSEDRSA